MVTPTPRSLFLEGLQRPKFTETDPSVIVQEILDIYQLLLGKVIYPAQYERLLTNLQGFRESDVRGQIQVTGEQNLVAFAVDEALDYLAQNIGVYRNTEAPSEAVFRFVYDTTLAGGLPEEDVQIDEGTQISIGGSAFQLRWNTLRSVVIRGTRNGGHASVTAEGFPYVDVSALCNTPGTVSNGFDVGEINAVVNPPAFITASNITQATQGRGTESDFSLRERTYLAPYLFSGGHVNSYRAYVRAVSTSITDVGIIIPKPGTIHVFPLTNTGPPPPGLILEVSTALKNDNANRPLTDDVVVLAPEVVPFNVDVGVYIYRGALQGEVQQAVTEAINSYLAERAPRIGRDIVPSQIVDSVMNIGRVYRAIVNEPSYIKLTDGQWAQSGTITVRILGEEDG